jgi:hypothetical protein
MWLSSQGFWRLEQSIGTLLRGLLINRSKVDGLGQFITWYTSQKSDSQRHLVLDDLSFSCFPDKEKTALVNFLNTFNPGLGSVLITTRLEKPVLLEQGIDPSKIRLIEMNSFSKDEANTFLSTRLLGDILKEHEKRQIMECLQYSPVGLALFAAFGSHCMGVNGEKDAWHKLKDQISGEGALNVLEHTLKAAVDHVANSNDKSYKMLCCMSVLDTQGVPLPLLYVSWAKESPHYTLEIRRGLRRLLSLSLIRCSRDGYQCFIDELIRTYLYKRLLEDDTLMSYRQGAIKDLDAIFANVHQSMLLHTCEALIPHIRQVINYEAYEGPSETDQKKSNDSNARISRPSEAGMAMVLRLANKAAKLMPDNVRPRGCFPPSIIFAVGRRLLLPGFCWAPQSYLYSGALRIFSTFLPLKVHDTHLGITCDRPSGVLCENGNGLRVMFPGFTITKIDSVRPVAERFIVDLSDEPVEGMPKFLRCTFVKDVQDGGRSWEDIAPKNSDSCDNMDMWQLAIIVDGFNNLDSQSFSTILVRKTGECSEGGYTVERLGKLIGSATPKYDNNATPKFDDHEWVRDPWKRVKGRWLPLTQMWCVD